MHKISVVIPAFNEEGNLEKIVSEILQKIPKQHLLEIIIVDDGSTDKTLETLKTLNKINPDIHFISFSKNFGHQNALKAGIDFSSGDCVISLDADMQHPPELIPQMIEKWEAGFDIILTKRVTEKSFSLFKKITSALFYKIMNFISDVKLEEGAADFWLIDKKISSIIKNSTENNLFFRGFIPWVGFKSFQINYKPNARYTGDSKYSLKKMINLALNGITSFSIKPLRLAIFMSFIAALFAIGYLFYVLYFRIFTNIPIPGWSSVLASILIFGSLNLLFLGILGEYIGKLFVQSKGRPSYIIKEIDEKLTNFNS